MVPATTTLQSVLRFQIVILFFIMRKHDFNLVGLLEMYDVALKYHIIAKVFEAFYRKATKVIVYRRAMSTIFIFKSWKSPIKPS